MKAKRNTSLACVIVITISPSTITLLPALRSAQAIRPNKVVIVDTGANDDDISSNESQLWWEWSDTETKNLLAGLTYEKKNRFPKEEWQTGVAHIHIAPECHVSPEAAADLVDGKHSAFLPRINIVLPSSKLGGRKNQNNSKLYRIAVSLFFFFDFVGLWWKLVVMNVLKGSREIKSILTKDLRFVRVEYASSTNVEKLDLGVHPEVHMRIEDPHTRTASFRGIVQFLIWWLYYGAFLIAPLIGIVGFSSTSPSKILIGLYIGNLIHLYNLAKWYWCGLDPAAAVAVGIFHPFISYIYTWVWCARACGAAEAHSNTMSRKTCLSCNSVAYIVCIFLTLATVFGRTQQLPPSPASFLSTIAVYPYILCLYFMMVYPVFSFVSGIFRFIYNITTRRI